MKSRWLALVTAIALWVALATPVSLAAQQNGESRRLPRYKIVVPPTLGGTFSQAHLPWLI